MALKLLSLLLIAVVVVPLKQDRYRELREDMVDKQIEARGISDRTVDFGSSLTSTLADGVSSELTNCSVSGCRAVDG